MKYIMSPLEQKVTKMYQHLLIMDPDDLTEENLCFLFRIYLQRHPAKSISIQYGNYKTIILDSRLSPQEQKEDFFHELAHILRHSGRQIKMPKDFKDLQEWDAKRFVLYAAMPIHMFHLFDLKDPNLIENMAKRFGVTTELCHERLTKIKEKMLEMKRINTKTSRINHAI